VLELMRRVLLAAAVGGGWMLVSLHSCGELILLLLLVAQAVLVCLLEIHLCSRKNEEGAVGCCSWRGLDAGVA
jgi:hypothetical protein